MRKPFKIILVVAALSVPVFGGVAVTDNSFIATDNFSDWPPLILERPINMQHSFGSENFKIHYDTYGPNAVCHPDEDIDPVDGVPDYINRMASYLEHARTTYLVELEYDRPPPDEGMGGDDRYDIYVTQVTGSTVPEFQSDYYPGRQAYAAYSFIGRDLRNEHHPDDPLPFLKATCAHEYFHAVQMAYRAYLSDDTRWWPELTANWAEERVFDDLNEVYYYLDDYYLKINYSLYLTGGSHMYGAWVLAEYFSQKYGNDIIRLFFEKLINFSSSLDAITASLSEMGLNFNSEFATYACWNYFTSYNSMPGFFEEGESFPVTVPLAGEHYDYPVDWQDNQQSVENLGIAYIYFETPPITKGDLVINFGADLERAEELCVAAKYLSKPIELTTYSVQPDRVIEIRVEDFYDCQGVVMSIDYRYQGVASEDSAGYRYSAYIDTTIVGITDLAEPLPESFKLMGNYPNPFNLSSEIIFYWNSKSTDYTITVYDITGREVDLLKGRTANGINRINWTAEGGLASGTYFYLVSIADEQAGGKMLLLK